MDIVQLCMAAGKLNGSESRQVTRATLRSAEKTLSRLKSPTLEQQLRALGWRTPEEKKMTERASRRATPMMGVLASLGMLSSPVVARSRP